MGMPRVLGNGAVGDGATAGDGPVGQSALYLQTEHFGNLAHGQPLVGHLCLLVCFQGDRCHICVRLASAAFYGLSPAPEWVDDIHRNR
jgi:hypothetical protein